MYSICSGLVLSNDTISMFDATTNICSECDKKLISSFDFKKLMIQSEEVLLAYQTDCKNGMSQVKFENCENDDEQNLCTILDDLQKVEKLEVDGEMFTVTHEEHLLQDEEESSLVIEKLLNSDDSNVSADEYVEEYHDSKDPEDPDTALNFACEYCGKTYKKKSTLKAHMSKNHTENLEEEYLDETDHRKELLKLKKSELNKKRYLCPHCGKMALSSHIKLCVPLEGGVIDGKPFACDQCGLKYKTSNSLTKHKRKHTDDRRYQCSYCKECFLHW